MMHSAHKSLALYSHEPDDRSAGRPVLPLRCISPCIAWLNGWRGYRVLSPTLPKVDKIDDPCNRVEAENCERDPSPVVTLCEEPCKYCVNETAGDHGTHAGFKHDAETNADDERQDAKIVAPPERPLPWIAPP